MRARLRGYQRTLLAALLAFAGGSLLGACTDATAPARARSGHVAFAPTVSAAAAAALGSSSTVIDNVRIIIRAADGTIVFDRIVPFPAGADEVSIEADIPVHGDGERFRATIQLRSGDEVLFEGTQDLDVRPGEQSGPPPPIPVTYVGTGANAASLGLAPGDVELLPNGTSQLVATVRDGGGNIIQNVPIGWTSSNEDVATVSEDGIVTAKSVRGTAVITATTFGGVSGTTSARVVLPPSQLRVAGGSGQTASVGETLSLALVVELLAGDGVGVANATISFGAPGTGSSITPPTATTDANGRATAIMKLGTIAGPYTFTASASSFTASANATAIAGIPNRIAIASGNLQSALTGTALPLPLAVRVTDEFGNPGAGREVNWTVVTAGSLASTTSTTNAAGLATNTYTLPIVAGEHLVYATLSGGGGVQFSATALQRPAATIVATSGTPQTGLPGTAAQSLVVRVTDALNQPVNAASVSWTVNGTATVGAPTSTTNAGGFASIAANFGPTSGTSTITASIPGATSAQFTLTTTVGPPANLLIVAGNNQTGSSGTPVPIAPSVRLTDAFGNPIAGVQITFDSASGGGFVTAGLQVTDANGVATVGNWTLGTFAGTQTLKARTGALSVSFSATVPPTAFFIGQASGDGQIVAPSTPLQPLVVHASDFSESGVPGVTIQFTVISGTAVPMSGSSVTDANGHASFTPTAPGAPGSTVVKACIMPACSIFTTFTFATVTTGSIWRGTASSDWFNPANWNTGAVPTALSDVLIPGDATNFVVLTGTPTMKTLFMASGSLMSLNTFDVDIAGNVSTTDAFVFGTGVFRIAGATTVIKGSMPSLLITGIVTATNGTSVNGNVTVQAGGRLNIGAGAMTVSGGFNVDPTGRLTMTNAAGTLSIDGDALFNGQDMGDTELTAGLLEIGGNLTSTGFTQAFRAAGTHTTRLTGFNTQTLFFSAAGAASSRFQNLEITNASAGGITMSSNVYTAGTLQQGGQLTVPGTRIFTIAGALTLQTGSITTVDIGGSLIHGGCTNLGGTANGFTC